MTNTLLEQWDLPPFSRISPEQIEPAITELLNEARSSLLELLNRSANYSWENLIRPLEDLDDRINRVWSPIRHLNAVVNSDALRDAYNACLPKLSEYTTEVGQNQRLFQAYQAIADSEAFKSLDTAQKKVIRNALRDFRLAGVALNDANKARYKEIARELSTLSSQFQDNLLDATNAWTKYIEDEADLAGLPESARTLARETANARDKTGWLLTLEFPCYVAVTTFADNRELRKEMFYAYSTRASDQGPLAGRWENSEIMENILALRHEQAQLLGYRNYAELSLATKMAESPDQVTTFLTDLAERSYPFAKRDFEELRSFVRDRYGLEDLEAWDIRYYSEKLRQYRFELSQEEVRQYFPVANVVTGLFSVVERLYGLKIQEIHEFDSWHKDVRFFEIRDEEGNVRGRFFIDLYARPKKRPGAWMDVCVSRRGQSDGIQIPVAYLTCNFTPPSGNDPALLTHEEVITLFHEIGHGLHHLLTQIDYLGVSGINGVEWDAVELPSQFMENWCWEKESLALISGHYRTGEAIPDSLFRRMRDAKNFQSGMQIVRQLEFALFDFRIHNEFDPKQGGRIYQILDQVRQQVAVVTPPAFDRFAHGFAHIFAGGYGAGYYSYKWAEVLSSDAFSLFEENGIFDAETGRSFLKNVLEKGGSEDAMALFVAFRGREPRVDALLRHCGIAD